MEIVDTPTFQRLRRIKQLAMASQVYPGADHSRFVHSLGVFSIMSRLVTRLNQLASKEVLVADQEKLRLAALLHDIGHYPYSHLMEHVKLPSPKGEAASTAIEPKGTADHGSETPGEYPAHEDLGAWIIKQRKDVSGVLEGYGFDPEEIGSTILGKHGGKGYYNQLATSSLDVDRLDYLLRDAHYTGVPFGGVDIEYILRSISFDREQNICLDPKCTASAEHFLLSRWYNYQAVVYQKTVMGMEALSRQLLQELVNRQELPQTQEEIYRLADSDGGFLTFDDQFVDSKIRALAADVLTSDPVGAPLRAMAYALLNRVKPRCVFEAYEEPRPHSNSTEVELFDRQVPANLDSWADKFDVPRRFWLMADSQTRSLEEVRRYGSLTDEMADKEGVASELSQAAKKVIRIKKPDGNSRFLVDEPTSLLNQLWESKFRVVRVYVLFPEEVRMVAGSFVGRQGRLRFKRRAQQIQAGISGDLGLAEH